MANLKAHSGNFGHFPDKIPPDARNAHFYFDDGGFYGDYTAELCYELPAAQLEAIYEDCVARGTRFVRPNAAGFFPPGKEIMLMSSITEVTGGFQTYNPDFEYTTFEVYRGMAINRKSHQVLYWAFSM